MSVGAYFRMPSPDGQGEGEGEGEGVCQCLDEVIIRPNVSQTSASWEERLAPCVAIEMSRTRLGGDVFRIGIILCIIVD